jgi:hypothetical protein
MDEPRRKLIRQCENIIAAAGERRMTTPQLFVAAINGIVSIANGAGIETGQTAKIETEVAHW